MAKTERSWPGSDAAWMASSLEPASRRVRVVMVNARGVQLWDATWTIAWAGFVAVVTVGTEFVTPCALLFSNSGFAGTIVQG